MRERSGFGCLFIVGYSGFGGSETPPLGCNGRELCNFYKVDK
jgi:hypothetical protein